MAVQRKAKQKTTEGKSSFKKSVPVRLLKEQQMKKQQRKEAQNVSRRGDREDDDEARVDKNGADGASSPRKRRRTEKQKEASASTSSEARTLSSKLLVPQDRLPWKKLERPFEAGFDLDGGLLELEEVDGVEVRYEEQEGGGRIVKFALKEERGEGEGNVGEEKEEAEGISSDDSEEQESRDESGEAPGEEAERENAKGKGGKEDGVKALSSGSEEERVEETFDDALLPAWSSIPLHPSLKHALLAMNFTAPTNIQAAALPKALEGRDVVGVAETGSGKTLAYGMAILHHILANTEDTSPSEHGSPRRPLSALVLAPTRELALQVTSHLSAVLDARHARAASSSSSDGGPRGRRVVVASVCGGMSVQKQKRVLGAGPDVIVATPGRLWDLLGDDDDLSRQVKWVRFLVVDEADRMIEAGHFKELDSILKLTRRRTKNDEGFKDEFDADEAGAAATEAREDIQTFVFSATLSKELQRDLRRGRGGAGGQGKGSKDKGKRGTTLEELVLKMDFRDEHPFVINLAPERGVADTLMEAKLECLKEDKDLYLYYFLLRYPGRTLVFVNSVDGIRRLQPLLSLLRFQSLPLHSHLQQRQRLKNLDRFKAATEAVLLATDVAARGLDVPSVEHVVHYQLPRTADAYVHRSGRTARAKSEGVSLVLCGPEEKKGMTELMRSLRREDELPDLPVEASFLARLKERIELVRQIDQAEHRLRKEQHDRSWLREQAEALEIEMDSDFVSDSDDSNSPAHRQSKGKANGSSSKSRELKARLSALLKQPLTARGVSHRYITSGRPGFVEGLLDGRQHATLLGVEMSAAKDDVGVNASKVGRGGSRKRRGAVEEEAN